MKNLFTIPNFITLGNLFCGCLAIYFIILGKWQWAVSMTFASLILDFFDGLVARWLNQHSSIGVQLDSLADMISFSVAPGFMLFALYGNLLNFNTIVWWQFLAFLVPAFAALRLAKFNVEERPPTYFYGLATPAMTLFVVGVYAAILGGQFDFEFLLQPLFFIGIIVILCFLMVSDIRLISNKQISLNLAKGWAVWLVVSITIVLVLLFQFLGLSLSIVAYILVSIIANYLVK